jgi:NADP oxidoreductase coenzyme F420-dependent
MRIAVIGAGNIGGNLARRLAGLGHQVTVANSGAPGLVDQLGFDPVDAGPLAGSGREQPGTPVYGTELGADGVIKALAAASPLVAAGRPGLTEASTRAGRLSAWRPARSATRTTPHYALSRRSPL